MATAASSNTLVAADEHFCADGWKAKMIGFRVLAAIKDLNMAVEVGLVTGVTPAITPTGSATFLKFSYGFSSITPTVFSYLMLW
ncbi:hypothetical protein D3C71_1843420 [compost metagenome]